MRRALNVLQACHAAYDRIDEVAVYNCTGNPLPADVENIVESMMNAEFTTAYKRESIRPCNKGIIYSLSFILADVSDLKVAKGMALADMVNGIYDCIQTINLPPQSQIYLLDQLAQIE
jgi:replication factor C subunit 3/5